MSEKRPTLRDVASAAGVSKSLVSLVYANPDAVSDARRERVLAAADELGYRPNLVARSLRSTGGNLVLILVADLHNPLFADIIDAAREELSRAGEVSLLTAATLPSADGPAELDRGLLNLLDDLRPRGVIVVGTVPSMSEVGYLTSGVPVVVASAVPEGLPDAQAVHGDDAAGMRLLVDHLVERGHRRIAHVGGEGGPVAARRAAAYADAMRAVGLADQVHLEPADYSTAEGARAAGLLLAAHEPPTAITASNDISALGVLGAADDAGLRIAVTGYDNSFVASLREVSLTTIDPGNAAIGRAAAQTLVAAITDSDAAVEPLAPPTLVVRGSTLGA